MSRLTTRARRVHIIRWLACVECTRDALYRSLTRLTDYAASVCTVCECVLTHMIHRWCSLLFTGGGGHAARTACLLPALLINKPSHEPSRLPPIAGSYPAWACQYRRSKTSGEIFHARPATPAETYRLRPVSSLTQRTQRKRRPIRKLRVENFRMLKITLICCFC